MEATPYSLNGLNTSLIGRCICHYSAVSSTMDVARQAAQSGAAEGTVIIADEQTTGRGRLRRSWISPKGCALAVSIIVRPSMQELPRLFMVSALAAARGIERATDVRTQLKWPNDVLIGGRKVCGILIESEIRGTTANWAIIGAGINISLETSRYAEIATTATSLKAESGREVSFDDVLRSFLEEFEMSYLALRHGRPVHEEWAKRLVTLGTRVRASTGESIEIGMAESVDEDGALLLRRDDGSLARVVAGDVSLRI